MDAYRRAAECDTTNKAALYKAAWSLATCPDAQARDGQSAVKYARLVCEADKWRTWSYVLAVAESEAGDFANARQHLKTALDAAPAAQRAAFKYLDGRFARGVPLQAR